MLPTSKLFKHEEGKVEEKDNGNKQPDKVNILNYLVNDKKITEDKRESVGNDEKGKVLRLMRERKIRNRRMA